MLHRPTASQEGDNGRQWEETLLTSPILVPVAELSALEELVIKHQLWGDGWWAPCGGNLTHLLLRRLVLECHSGRLPSLHLPEQCNIELLFWVTEGPLHTLADCLATSSH